MRKAELLVLALLVTACDSGPVQSPGVTEPLSAIEGDIQSSASSGSMYTFGDTTVVVTFPTSNAMLVTLKVSGVKKYTYSGPRSGDITSSSRLVDYATTSVPATYGAKPATEEVYLISGGDAAVQDAYAGETKVGVNSVSSTGSLSTLGLDGSRTRGTSCCGHYVSDIKWAGFGLIGSMVGLGMCIASIPAVPGSGPLCAGTTIPFAIGAMGNWANAWRDYGNCRREEFRARQESQLNGATFTCNDMRAL